MGTVRREGDDGGGKERNFYEEARNGAMRSFVVFLLNGIGSTTIILELMYADGNILG